MRAIEYRREVAPYRAVRPAAAITQPSRPARRQSLGVRWKYAPRKRCDAGSFLMQWLELFSRRPGSKLSSWRVRRGKIWRRISRRREIADNRKRKRASRRLLSINHLGPASAPSSARPNSANCSGGNDWRNEEETPASRKIWRISGATQSTGLYRGSDLLASEIQCWRRASKISRRAACRNSRHVLPELKIFLAGACHPWRAGLLVGPASTCD